MNRSSAVYSGVMTVILIALPSTAALPDRDPCHDRMRLISLPGISFTEGDTEVDARDAAQDAAGQEACELVNSYADDFLGYSECQSGCHMVESWWEWCDAASTPTISYTSCYEQGSDGYGQYNEEKFNGQATGTWICLAIANAEGEAFYMCELDDQ